MFSIKKTILLVLSALICTSINAENVIELGYDQQGNRWKVTKNPATVGKSAPDSYLQVEFPKSRHFRHHHQIKMAQLAVRVICDTRDIAIDHIKLQDKLGAEIANLSASDSSLMYAHLLPETIKNTFFAHACTEDATATGPAES